MDIRKYLEENILLFDGAMGTYFSSVNEDPLYKCEYANITSPNTIKEIHARYLKAGAKAIKTNTFSLYDSGEEQEFSYKQIIKAGYKIAMEIAREYDAYVFCDIGPIQKKRAIDGAEEYKKIVDAFIEEGGTNFLFETFLENDDLHQIGSYIKSRIPHAFVIQSYAVNRDGYTKLGNIGRQLLCEVEEAVDAVGFNCVCGPYHMNKLIQELHYDKKPLFISPNASYPTVIGNRVSYENNSHYFAKQLLENIESGARIVGGCCGTTPKFIEQIRLELDNQNIEKKVSNKKITIKDDIVIKKSDFYEKLQSKQKPIAVELDSPVNTQVGDFMEGAKVLQEAGVDIITIADCPVARARMDSSLLACKVKRELGMHTMPHMTCRDRNINASKALLLGLNIEDINNVLVITGDPIPSEQRDEVKAVYEFNSRMLIHHISNLNQTLFDNPFYLYAALNINARNFHVQLGLAKEKEKKGACAFFTQPVLSEQALENLKLAKAELNAPILGGILPIVSYRNACFINNEIPGIKVCDEIVELYQDKTREECYELAVKVSSEIAKQIEPYIDGYYLITPFKNVEIIRRIVAEIKK